jgi:hypothetical protein
VFTLLPLVRRMILWIGPPPAGTIALPEPALAHRAGRACAHDDGRFATDDGGRGAGVPRSVDWPDGKSFAFTIFDDTDNATRAVVAPVYEFLGGLGLRTTKSVWTVRGDGTPRIGGETCEDDDYRAWTLDLQAAGIEIGSHGATFETSNRERVILAMDSFREIYGHDPDSLANHADCAESIYWGADRVGGASRAAYNLMTGFRRRGAFRGHVEGDPLFWGDICRDRVRYVRNFTFRDVNTLRACPTMPYHDPERPYVQAWFAASEGADVTAFNERLSEANQDRLEAEGGACIMYTHLASGFCRDDRIDARFATLMRRLAGKNGWFVPVTTLLDHLAGPDGPATITPDERGRLERRWLLSKVRVGRT